MAFDPQNRDILYVGCDVGGFYYSTNAGRSYEIRNHGLHDYFVEAIAVHPKDSQVILLGTESGIHRTTNGGRSWQWIRQGFPPTNSHRFTASIGALCFDPLKPSIAFAGIGRPRVDKEGAGTIYRSLDTGVTWQRMEGGHLPAQAIVSDLELKPGDSRVILAATSEGIFRSDDAGNTWRVSSDGLPHRYTEELAFAPSSPQTVYVTLRCTASDNQPWNGGVFVSADAGLTWRDANGEGIPRRVSKSGNVRHLSSNPKEIVVDPRNAKIVYVGNRDWVSAGVCKTMDGGQRWTSTANYKNRTSGNMEYGWITSWGPAVECLAISPVAPERLAFGTSGHVFLSDDAASTWQQRYSRSDANNGIAGTGLEVTCAWRVIADPVRSNRLYFCYMDIGLLISDDQGKTFRRTVDGMKSGGNCFGVIVDPQAPDTLWAATGWWNRNEGDICRSDDGGKTWRVVGHPESGLPVGQVLEMVLDPKSPLKQRRLVATSSGNGLYETLDGGNSWHAINGKLPATELKQPHGLLLDPLNSDHLIAALGRNIYETSNSGKTWQKLNTTESFADIKQFVADSVNFSTLYVAARESYDQKARRMYPGGVFRSVDAGKTWHQILDFRFVHSVAINPLNSQVIYAATADHPFHDHPVALGLLRSADGGRSWQRENSGLSLLNLKAICINPHTPSTLYLSTSGNSVFIGHDAAVRK
jgi:photosystem II stability/assembly factor-like uncharacterized protein